MCYTESILKARDGKENFMATSNTPDQETELVRCTLCSNHVWIRRDRMEQHVRKVHPSTSPSKKSFTAYTARLASTFPPRVTPKAGAPRSAGSQGKANIRLTSRDGRRAGQGRCAECGVEALNLWNYAESDHGPVDICADCKPAVFERSFGATETD